MNIITDLFISKETLDKVAQALESGTIYNQDYQELKRIVNGGLSKVWAQMVTKVYLNDSTRFNSDGTFNKDFPAELQELYYTSPQIHTMKSAEKR